MKRLLPLVMIVSTGACIMASIGSCTKQSADKLTNGAVCDTTAVSYSAQIVPILQDNCYECHGSGRTAGSGGVDLSTYANLKAYADDGYLVGNVTHAPGYVGMPYGRAMLPSCEVNNIVAWVHQGAKNN